MMSQTERPFYETGRLEPDMQLRDDEIPDLAPPNCDEPDESSDLEGIDPDDERWDAFLADDDERDPQPGYGDFWPED